MWQQGDIIIIDEEKSNIIEEGKIVEEESKQEDQKSKMDVISKDMNYLENVNKSVDQENQIDQDLLWTSKEDEEGSADWDNNDDEEKESDNEEEGSGLMGLGWISDTE